AIVVVAAQLGAGAAHLADVDHRVQRLRHGCAGGRNQRAHRRGQPVLVHFLGRGRESGAAGREQAGARGGAVGLAGGGDVDDLCVHAGRVPAVVALVVVGGRRAARIGRIVDQAVAVVVAPVAALRAVGPGRIGHAGVAVLAVVVGGGTAGVVRVVDFSVAVVVDHVGALRAHAHAVLALEPAAAVLPGDAGHAGRPDIELHVELDRERARVAGEAAVSEEEQAVAGRQHARVGRHHRAAGSPARGLRGLVAAHVLAHVEDGLGKPGACGHG